MYAHFYHLSENPFNLTPDPKFHYINESTREALAAVLYGIKSRKGFLTLIGEAGTGKTTLLRRIVDEIEGETRIVFVFNPGVSFDELLEYLCMELGIRTDARGRLQLIERLNQFLLEQLTEGRNVVVIIDEAQTLEDDVLEELRLLSNLETSKEKILQVVLSGQPELEEKLRRPNLRQLRQRIGVRATLKPMRSDEIRAYVETRLRSAGGQKAELFTAAALRRCWQASQGIPRVINVICDNAMMVAFAEGNDRISVSVMNAAIRDLDGLTGSPAWLQEMKDVLAAPMVRYGLAAAVVLGLAFAVGRDGLPRFGVEQSPPTAFVARGEPLAPAALPIAPPVSQEAKTRVAAVAPVVAPIPERSEPLAPASAAPAAAAAGTALAGANVTAPPEVDPEFPPTASVLTPPAGDPRSGAGSPTAPLPTTDRVRGTQRRAEEIARQTAARMYGREVEPAPGYEPVPSSRQEALAALAATEQRDRQAAADESSARLAEEDAERLAAEAMASAAEDAVAAARAASVPTEAPPSLAAAPDGLADGLETVTAMSGGAARLPKAGQRPLVGRHVRVARGDTVWAIAMQYYGSVDPSVLTEIFRHNPGIRNARQLPVGSDVFVPFLKPEHMVDAVPGGGYRVLVAESPKTAEITEASEWASSRLPGRELTTTSKGRGNPVRMVYATGFGGRESAISAAKQLLGPDTQ